MLATKPAEPSRFGTAVMKAPREVEYAIFASVTRALQRAEETGGAKDIAKAVLDNSELWTQLASDLAEPANALPAPLKASLISLAMFSIKHGNKVMARSGAIGPLVDINMNIMKGLRSQGEA